MLRTASFVIAPLLFLSLSLFHSPFFTNYSLDIPPLPLFASSRRLPATRSRSLALTRRVIRETIVSLCSPPTQARTTAGRGRAAPERKGRDETKEQEEEEAKKREEKVEKGRALHGQLDEITRNRKLSDVPILLERPSAAQKWCPWAELVAHNVDVHDDVRDDIPPSA